MPTSAPPTNPPTTSTTTTILPLKPLTPDLHERAWTSTPHPTLPLIATTHAKAVTVFSLSTLSAHSTLTGGHTRSVRSASWKPGLPPHKLCLVTGSFDSTAGLWRWDGDEEPSGDALEVEVTSSTTLRNPRPHEDEDSEEGTPADKDWEFTLVLEGHDSELKSTSFSPAGNLLATCSRDKSVWIWEDVGAHEADDEWETIAVLSEHEGDVKALAWCPDVPSRNEGAHRRRCYGVECLASASYDNTVRVWREDGDGEWVCVAVLEGHTETVWGVAWEGKPRPDGKFPRLLSWSADSTIRVWQLKEDNDDEDEDGADGDPTRSSLGRIPNTMRRSSREEWTCTTTLPKVHNGDVYAAAWSHETGLVASVGSDGVLALYTERTTPPTENQDHPMTNGDETDAQAQSESGAWTVLARQENAHGPYEVNHVTWSKRFDAAAGDGRGTEEMLVTTGDDGVVRPWQVKTSSS